MSNLQRCAKSSKHISHPPRDSRDLHLCRWREKELERVGVVGAVIYRSYQYGGSVDIMVFHFFVNWMSRIVPTTCAVPG